MRLANALYFAASAGAFVLFDFDVGKSLTAQRPQDGEERPWWSRIPSKEDLVSSVDDTIESITSGFEGVLRSTKHELQEQFHELFTGGEPEDNADLFEAFGGDHPRRPRRPHRPHRPPHHGHGPRHDFSNLTIYEIISKSEYSTKFAKYVDKFDKIVDILNSTKDNITVFVPIDHHDKKKPGASDKPSDEYVESALEYLIARGLYPARRLFGTHTLPTLLTEGLLGDEPQRLRISFSFLGGLRVNFVAKVVAANIV